MVLYAYIFKYIYIKFNLQKYVLKNRTNMKFDALTNKNPINIEDYYDLLKDGLEKDILQIVRNHTHFLLKKSTNNNKFLF
jgi:hypothetical protein